MDVQNFTPAIDSSFTPSAPVEANNEWNTRRQRIQSTWCKSTRRERRSIAASMQELIGTLLISDNENISHRTA